MKNVLTIFIVLSVIYLQSQDLKSIDCVLEQDNKSWIIQFSEAESKSDQITLIKEKIISDSIYREIQPVEITAHGPILVYEDQNGNYCGCKIQFILQVTGDTWYELNLNKKPQLLSLLSELDSSNLDHIYYDLSNSNPALSPASRCGLVKLITRDSIFKRKVKNVW